MGRDDPHEILKNQDGLRFKQRRLGHIRVLSDVFLGHSQLAALAWPEPKRHCKGDFWLE
jgi:hypothetical protein